MRPYLARVVEQAYVTYVRDGLAINCFISGTRTLLQ
jgi:hypothetical protein